MTPSTTVWLVPWTHEKTCGKKYASTAQDATKDGVCEARNEEKDCKYRFIAYLKEKRAADATLLSIVLRNLTWLPRG